MRYGFVIDQTRCIGCHACTVACKAENNVPLGTFRTWVKYIERGEFPDTRRHFGVLRCNHCDDAPCMSICPTKALFRRPDGIVDFDSDRCIGCKSCMQACPYDALYIDPDEGTAAKCHYCSHRVDKGLEPACVIVCPEQAIISGDLDDPQSRISTILARTPVQVRKPEQGTRPKVFYIGADEAVLSPEIDRDRTAYFSSEPPSYDAVGKESEVREVYDVPHPQPWGLKVAAYLWTKSLAAGVLMMAAIFGLNGSGHPDLDRAAAILALAFIAITGLLLIFDLKRPERFWYLLVKSNFRSWLVWGAYILTVFTILSLVWLGLAFSGKVPAGLRWGMIPVSALCAGYSAFLFGQAEGRDFWQSPLLFIHLLIQAMLCGTAALLVVAPVPSMTWFLAALLGVHTLILFTDLANGHGTVEARQAAKHIVSGGLTLRFWAGVCGIGVLLPLGCLWIMPQVAALMVLIGLFEWERVWIEAGQSVPLS